MFFKENIYDKRFLNIKHISKRIQESAVSITPNVVGWTGLSLRSLESFPPEEIRSYVFDMIIILLVFHGF